MPGSSRASYAKVGFAVVAGAVALVGTLVYFGGMRGRADEFLAETYYDAPVSGLSVGSDVNYRGVKVGEVRSITFIGSDYPEAVEADRQKVRIVLAFNSRLVRARDGATPLDAVRHMVRKGVRATVSSSGITGLSKVDLDYPRIAPANAKLSWVPEYVCIPPAPSILESFADSATKVMNHLNGMDLAKTCADLAAMIDAASGTAEAVRGIVEAQRPMVDEILSNLARATADLKEFAAEIRENPALLLRGRAGDPPLPETAP